MLNSLFDYFLLSLNESDFNICAINTNSFALKLIRQLIHLPPLYTWPLA